MFFLSLLGTAYVLITHWSLLSLSGVDNKKATGLGVTLTGCFVYFKRELP